MPRFATKPAVFPPVVPAVNDRGDVPTYAFSDNGIVLAWTHPDEFLAERDRGFGYEITPEKRLTVAVSAYFERPTKTAYDRAIDAAEEEVAGLRRVFTSFDFDGVVSREDRAAPLVVNGVQGTWQAIGCAVVGAKKRPHDFTIRREHVLLPHAISQEKSKLVQLGAVRPGQRADYPVAEALACWRGAFIARISAPADEEYAAWYFDLGFKLVGITSDQGSSTGSDAGYIEPGDGRLGADAKVEILPPQRRATLDVERDLAESLRLAELAVRHPSTVDVVSRDIRCDGSRLAVLDGYEIVAGPENQSETIFATDPEDDGVEVTEEERHHRENWRFHPGVTTRVAYLPLGGEWFTRLTITAGARATDRLETWWQQLCERLWVWTA